MVLPLTVMEPRPNTRFHAANIASHFHPPSKPRPPGLKSVSTEKIKSYSDGQDSRPGQTRHWLTLLWCLLIPFLPLLHSRALVVPPSQQLPNSRHPAHSTSESVRLSLTEPALPLHGIWKYEKLLYWFYTHPGSRSPRTSGIPLPSKYYPAKVEEDTHHILGG